MGDLIDKLRQLIWRQSTPGGGAMSEQTNDEFPLPDDSTVIADQEVVVKLMHLIENTQENEYSCEETFDLLDEFVELVADDSDEAAAIMPLVQQHIDHCSDCHERYEILMQILQKSQ